MNILGRGIIYAYNDMSIYLVQVLGNKDLVNYFPMFRAWNGRGGIDTINAQINLILLSHFDIFVGINLIAILYILLNFYFSFLLFSKLHTNNIISFIFSIFYTFSIYFIYRVVSFTPNLYQIFFFPLIILLLLRYKGIKVILFSILLLIFFSFSSYYGFFSLIIVIFWFFSELFVSNQIFIQRIINFIKNTIIVLIPLILLLLIMYAPLVVRNLTFLSDLRGTNDVSSNNTRYRMIEDFYNFSFRPWYFFIPPQNSVYFGSLSKEIYKKIADTHYYLADDYSEREMAGSYMGWHFIIGTFVVFILLWLKKFKKVRYSLFNEIYKNEKLIIRCFVIIICILLISGPPSFTISGYLFYTPSYLLYSIAPAFRSLVRLSSVIYLFILIINYFLFLDFYYLLNKKLYRFLFIVIFVLLNYFLFAVEIPIIDTKQIPSEIIFLEKQKNKSTFVVYPRADYYSIFWILQHKKRIINPIGLKSSDLLFNSQEFTSQLITKEGIEAVKSMNVDYLVFYTREVSEELAPEINHFFTEQFGQNVFANNYSVIYSLK